MQKVKSVTMAKSFKNAPVHKNNGKRKEERAKGIKEKKIMQMQK